MDSGPPGGPGAAAVAEVGPSATGVRGDVSDLSSFVTGSELLVDGEAHQV